MNLEETNIDQQNNITQETNQSVDSRQEIKVSKEKIKDLKTNIWYAYLFSLGILLLNSFFLKLDISLEHSSKGYLSGYSYWVTNEGNDNDFKGLFKFGNDVFESEWIAKLIGGNSVSYYYDINKNPIYKTLVGNIPFIILGNFFLLTLLAAIIFFIRKEIKKFKAKYKVKLE